MKLAEFQSRFQSAVLGEPDADFLARLAPPARGQDIGARFAIYRDGHALRMSEFLGADYPALRAWLDDRAFGDMARAYAAARPSRWRNARWFGAALPAFLRATPPYAENVDLCGLAAFEAALTEAFDAADVSPLAIELLGATPEEAWPGLRFGFHPSLVVVETTASALAFHQSARSGPAAPAAGAGSIVALVWREGLDLRTRVADALEALALREARAGTPFGEICALLAFARPDSPPDEVSLTAAGFLATWFAGGMIVAVETATA